MKNVLLLVHDDEGQESRLQAALDLTRTLNGHLSCIDVMLFPSIILDPYFTGYAQAIVLEDQRERESKNKSALESRLAHEGVSWDWTDALGNFVDATCGATLLTDLIVLNRSLDRFPYPDMRDVASRVLMRARTPVLAVPDDLRQLRVDRALIAWDGQASCAATMKACVPLLQLASTVEIVTVGDNAVEAPPTAAARYLSRHGIHGSVRVVAGRPSEADRYIAEAAEAFGADYLMMGAYSHGRLMEALGGVTKRMLADATLPLILGH